MKNVLIIGPGPQYIGGISEFIQGLINSDLSKIYNFTLFDSLELKKRDRAKAGSKFSFQEIKATFGLFSLFRKYLKQNKVDIVHIHSSSYFGFYEKLILALIAKNKNIKVVFHIHGGEFVQFFQNNPLKKILNYFLTKLDSIICVSEEIRNVIDVKNKGTVIGNGIILPNVEKQLNDKIRFLSISVLEKRKRIDLIIEAITELKEKYPNSFEFHFAGNGPEKEALLEQINQNVIGDYVKYHGVVLAKDKDKLLRESDVFISASLAESFGISIAEGMSYKLGIISTAEGIAKTCIQKENGFIIQKNSAESIEKTMTKYLENPKLILIQGENNYKFIAENFSWNVISSKIAKIYN